MMIRTTTLLLLSLVIVGPVFASDSLELGHIRGTYIVYYDTDEIIVLAGEGECNGNYWILSSADTVDVSASLSSGDDYIYIYIDDDNSTYPTPTFTHTTTEPTWSDSKLGWYNGADRSIGAVWTPSGATEVKEFATYANYRYVYITPYAIGKILEGGNPNGDWQTLSTASDYIPVNSTAVRVWAHNCDASDKVEVRVTPVGSPYEVIVDRSTNGCAAAAGWLGIEPHGRGARDLQWYGEDNDNNSFDIIIQGYEIRP